MIVDTFLFSEPYEKEVLLTKFHLQAPMVDQFILIESAFTFRGEYKGLHARRMMEEDDRFAPFMGKVHVISHHIHLYSGPPGYQTFFVNERRSRESATDHLLSSFPDDTLVLVSDADEAADFTHPDRTRRFLEVTASCHARGNTPHFGHYRYWWDWDNRCYWTAIATPVVSVGWLRTGRASLAARTDPRTSPAEWVNPDPHPVFFEYSFCFPKEACWKKLTSFIHDGYTKEELENSLLANHWVKARARGEVVGSSPHDWFEKVELNEQNSPAYVRENLSHLKTGIIPDNYREHRRRLYGV